MSEPTQIVCPHCDAVNRVPASRLAEKPRCGRCKHVLFEARAPRLTEARARRHIQNSGVPLLVVFWAAWHVRSWWMGPDIARAARQLEPAIRVVKVSTEEAPKLARELDIATVPTLVLFRDGREVKRADRPMKASEIVSWARAKDPDPPPAEAPVPGAA